MWTQTETVMKFLNSRRTQRFLAVNEKQKFDFSTDLGGWYFQLSGSFQLNYISELRVQAAGREEGGGKWTIRVYLRIFQGLANHSMLDKNCSQYQFVGPATVRGIVGGEWGQ